VVVVHGGAWAIPDSLEAASRAGVRAAGRAAFKVLKDGGSALEAVTEAVRLLEDDPTFDAGKGSVLTKEGQVEMDAMVMEGQELGVGAIACVRNVKNPVLLARRVLEGTPHTMMVGEGAERLALEDPPLQLAGRADLVTAAGEEEWERFKKYNQCVSTLFCQQEGHDTVGAVALDLAGNVASATSTGGITGKRGGRVGDSPLAGSGGYADSRLGAVSTTGHGESITKVCLAHRVVQAMQGNPANKAGREGLAYMQNRVGGSGGLVAVDVSGRWAAEFTTVRMPWSAITREGEQHGFLPGENLSGCY